MSHKLNKRHNRHHKSLQDFRFLRSSSDVSASVLVVYGAVCIHTVSIQVCNSPATRRCTIHDLQETDLERLKEAAKSLTSFGIDVCWGREGGKTRHDYARSSHLHHLSQHLQRQARHCGSVLLLELSRGCLLSFSRTGGIRFNRVLCHHLTLKNHLPKLSCK